MNKKIVSLFKAMARWGAAWIAWAIGAIGCMMVFAGAGGMYLDGDFSTQSIVVLAAGVVIVLLCVLIHEKLVGFR